MSATALLQKAAQMGVTTTTKMPSYSDHSILLGPHLDHVPATSSTPPPPPVFPSRDLILPGSGAPFLPDIPSFAHNNSNNKLVQLQDMIMAATSSTSLGFGDATVPAGGGFDALMNHPPPPPRRNDLTRDFLGLRAFPHHREFVNMAGLDQMGSSSYDQQRDGDQNQAPWQS